MPLNARQAVEFFHLVFLRALVAKGEDKALFALKGGCNLRFFFGSMRYSEDIDLDVVVIRRDTLKNKVDRLLRSPLVVSPLKAQGVELVHVSTPKQTDTVQRWKAGLKSSGLSVELRTKIEGGAKVAGMEKALFDVAYVSGGRSRLFASLPELELPRGFRKKELRRWIEKIPSRRARTLTTQRLDAFLAQAAVRKA